VYFFYETATRSLKEYEMSCLHIKGHEKQGHDAGFYEITSLEGYTGRIS